MARVYGKNPIDPATGKPKRGRPTKVTPVDTISGPQPQEQAVGVAPQVPVQVRHLNPKEDVSTELATLWYKRMSDTELMTIPDEFTKKYPDGSFCYAPDTKEGVAKYRTTFGYEIAESSKPLPGQTDTAFRFGDTVLMVRPKELEKVHRQVEREKVLAQLSNKSADERAAEREAQLEAQQHGYDNRNRALSFEGGVQPDEEAYERDRELTRGIVEELKNRPKGAAGRGSKYWSGGIPK